MKKFLFLLLAFPLLATAQNGGQYMENNVVKVQYAGGTTYWVISKQNCTASYTVDYGTVEVVIIPALDTIFIEATTVSFKAKAIQGTTCISQPDMGWVELDGAVLPVKLISFKGVQKDGKVKLEWTVINETVGKFNIEKSTDGKMFSTIATIGKVPGFGSTTYTAADNLSGITYYRLKMYDDHGKAEYSRLVTFRGSLAYKFKLYSNPVTDRILFSIVGTKDEIINVKLVDMQGRVVRSKFISVAAGENLVDIPVQLPIGVYSLHAGTFTQKIIKK